MAERTVEGEVRVLRFEIDDLRFEMGFSGQVPVLHDSLLMADSLFRI